MVKHNTQQLKSLYCSSQLVLLQPPSQPEAYYISNLLVPSSTAEAQQLEKYPHTQSAYTELKMEKKVAPWTDFSEEKSMRKEVVTAAVILPVDQCPLPRLNSSLTTQQTICCLTQHRHTLTKDIDSPLLKPPANCCREI